MTDNDLLYVHPAASPFHGISERRRDVFLSIILVLSLVLKIAIAYFATDPIIFNKYPYFAQRIAQGIDIGERLLDLSPFYLYATVMFYKLFGPNWEVLTLLQVILGSVTCLAIYQIGTRLFGVMTGFIAAMLLMLCGNVTLIELTLEPEAFVLLFNSLAIWALLWAGDEHQLPFRPWRWLPAGILIGLSAITKANGLLILPGALIWVWFSMKTLQNRSRAAAVLLLAAVLFITPITLRNYILFHDFVPITADGGKVFSHGNGPGATGMERSDLPDQGFLEERQVEPDHAHSLFRETARTESKAPLTPSECSTYWYSRTLDHIYADPGAAFFLFWKKFCLFWNNYEAHDLDTTYKNYLTLQGWPLLNMGMLAALGLIGMGLALRGWRRAFPLYWMVFISLMSVLIFFAASRYRLPAVPFLCIFASYGLVQWLHFIRGKEIIKIICWLISLAIFLVCAYLPYREEIQRFDRWQQASRIHYSLGGKMLFQKGQYREAISELEKVISADPNFAPAYNIMGKSYAILGDFEKAKRCFETVIMLTPRLDEGYLNMGLLHKLQGDDLKANAFLQKAQELNPGNIKTRSHLDLIQQDSIQKILDSKRY